MKFFGIFSLLAGGGAAIPTYGFYLTQVNTGPGTLCQLDNGSRLIYQTDGNLGFYSSSGSVLWSIGRQAPGGVCNNSCTMAFQNDGNFVTYFNGSPYFSTGTGGGQGALLVCTQASPYLMVLNINGNKIWTTGR